MFTWYIIRCSILFEFNCLATNQNGWVGLFYLYTFVIMVLFLDDSTQIKPKLKSFAQWISAIEYSLVTKQVMDQICKSNNRFMVFFHLNVRVFWCRFQCQKQFSTSSKITYVFLWMNFFSKCFAEILMNESYVNQCKDTKDWNSIASHSEDSCNGEKMIIDR